jgi:CBS domain containing-hemolysin-like protein
MPNINGPFEIAERSLHGVLRPRREVVMLDADERCDEEITKLIASGHSRAPVARHRDLDDVLGVVDLRDLISRDAAVTPVAVPPRPTMQLCRIVRCDATRPCLPIDLRESPFATRRSDRPRDTDLARPGC